MLASTAQIESAANYRTRASASVPYVAAATLGRGKFTSAASSDWLFQQAETSGAPKITVCVGSPVSGVLLVERENNLRSIQYLTDLGNEKYSLTDVLTVAVEKDGDQFVVTEPRRGWYGYGDSEEQAVARFASRIVEDLEVLTERQDRLSDSLLRELSQLKQAVVPRR